MHGGATPRGLASPSLKHGRYSPWLPKNLLGRYETQLADENRASLADELALVRSLLGELLERLPEDADVEPSLQPILAAIESTRKLAETLTRRDIAVGEMVPLADVIFALDQIAQAVAVNVPDPVARAGISAAFARTTGRQLSALPHHAGEDPMDAKSPHGRSVT